MPVKPKLLFFQWDHRGIPEFAQLHMRLHVRCLAEFFNVTVINRDCDYAEVCDRYEPDLTLFEAGVNYRGSRRPAISNTAANAAVPKLGLHNGDGWCEARSGFLSDMDRWGVSTFFTISTTTAEHTPAVAECTYVWPNFVDAELYRDYGARKLIPVMISGMVGCLYPWRERVHSLLTRHYAALNLPHHGYQGRDVARTLYGEQYARAINASLFVTSCGTVANEFVRKHLEIPGAGACLLTEDSPSLAAAGFVSMKNCVFADADDVLDKIDYLLGNPAELAEITAAGHHLVHSQHTMRNRDQIYQWFRLQAASDSKGKIVQRGPFGPLVRVPESAAETTVHVCGRGAHLNALREGDRMLAVGRYGDAEVFYRRCSNYAPVMPEPRLKLAWCALNRGEPQLALDRLRHSLEYTLDVYKASDPDPVEWALLVLATLCTGDVARADIRARRFPHLSHAQLDRARWAVAVLRKDAAGMTVLSDHDESRRSRRSVHDLADYGFQPWADLACDVLSACGQNESAEILRRALPQAVANLGKRASNRHRSPTSVSASRGFIVAPSDLPSSQRSLFRARSDRGALQKALRASARWVIARLNRLEVRSGYFLPYRYSAVRHHPFTHSIQRLIWNEGIQSVLVLGARAGVAVTEAILAASFRSQRLIYLSNRCGSAVRKLEKRYGHDTGIRFIDSVFDDNGNRKQGATETVNKGRMDFDLLVIASGDAAAGVSFEMSHRSRFVVVAEIDRESTFESHQQLLASSTHQLFQQDLVALGGYALFENVTARPPRVARISEDSETTMSQRFGNALSPTLAGVPEEILA